MTLEAESADTDFDLGTAADEVFGDEPNEAEMETEVEGEGTEEDESAEGQSKEEPQEEGAEELTPEQILEQFARGGKEVDPKDGELLKQLQSLGLVHNGMPIQVKDTAHAKELIQKGFDYTAKTMQHAQERRQWEQERTQRETEFKQREAQFGEFIQTNQRSLQSWQMMTAVLKDLAHAEPDLYREIEARYNQIEQQQSAFNPILNTLNQRFEQLEKRFQGTEQKRESAEVVQLREQLNTEISSLQERYNESLAKMGIVADWNRIKQTWANDATQKMTVMQAFLAVHGDAIMKHNKQSQNLLQLKNKNLQKHVHKGAGSKRATGTLSRRVAVGDYDRLLMDNADLLG